MSQETVVAACQQYSLNNAFLIGRRKLGDKLGRSSGDSLEFSAFREYVAGDDLRHLDWAAFARTGQLTMKQYLEETSPHVEIILDVSQSMAIEDGRKAELSQEIADFFTSSARLSGYSSKLFSAGHDLNALHSSDEVQYTDGDSVLFGSPQRCLGVMRRNASLVVVSDFLSINQPAQAIKKLAAHAASIVVIRVLGPWEADPKLNELLTLEDSEIPGQKLALNVSAARRERYLNRINEIQLSLQEITRAAGGLFIDVTATSSLTATLRTNFLPIDIVQVI